MASKLGGHLLRLLLYIFPENFLVPENDLTAADVPSMFQLQVLEADRIRKQSEEVFLQSKRSSLLYLLLSLSSSSEMQRLQNRMDSQGENIPLIGI